MAIFPCRASPLCSAYAMRVKLLRNLSTSLVCIVKKLEFDLAISIDCWTARCACGAGLWWKNSLNEIKKIIIRNFYDLHVPNDNFKTLSHLYSSDLFLRIETFNDRLTNSEKTTIFNVDDNDNFYIMLVSSFTFRSRPSKTESE